MRRQHIEWTFLVLSLVLTGYGTFSIVYNLSKGNEVPILGIIFVAVGGVLLLTYIVLLIISLIQKAKRQNKVVATVVEEKKEEIKETPKVEVKEEFKPVESKKRTYSDEVTYVRRSSRSIYDNDYSTVYVKKIGYGPILRVEGNRIYDMRANRYYRIEGRQVKLEGSGPVFEIYGDKIKKAFGGYLYEVSGDNINKVFGGYFASVSGNYLTKYDLSEKYEIGSLNKSQLLAVVVLIFGEY